MNALSEFDGRPLNGLVFCTKVYELFERIRGTEEGPSRLRMRATEVEKKLIEELLPIAKYVQATYRTGLYLRVAWLSGNQSFDAQVLRSGGFVERGFVAADAYIEVTCVMHPKYYLLRESIDKGNVVFGVEGISRNKETREITSEPVLRSNRDFIDSYFPLIVEGIAKKTEIAYPGNTTLVVQCSLNTVYMPEEWDELVAKVRAGMPPGRYRENFHEIFMFDENSGYSCSL